MLTNDLAITIKDIQQILKYDKRTSNYKIALVRAINDLAISYAGINGKGAGIAIPLRSIAELWLGYYWPFIDEKNPVIQGYARAGASDIAFGRELTHLKMLWLHNSLGSDKPSDGIILVSEEINGHLDLNLSKVYQIVLNPL